jgi:hypothetical protein
MITNRTSRRWIALALLLAAPACENPPETLGANNHVEVTNLAGHFQLTVDDMQNVTTEMTFKWQNPGQYADIQHLSFIPHGTALLIIKDAADSVRYDGELLYELDDRTVGIGVPGEWTVTFSLDESVGNVNVILDAAYAED